MTRNECKKGMKVIVFESTREGGLSEDGWEGEVVDVGFNDIARVKDKLRSIRLSNLKEVTELSCDARYLLYLVARAKELEWNNDLVKKATDLHAQATKLLDENVKAGESFDQLRTRSELMENYLSQQFT